MRVLIVDNTVLIRHLIDTTIDSKIDIVGQAVNELDAQSLYQELKPDLVVVNTVMSGLDNIKVINLIKDVNLKARIIIISSSSYISDIKEAQKEELVGYIILPIGYEDDDGSSDCRI